MTEEPDPQPDAAEPLRHVSAVCEQQLEQPSTTGAPDGERPRLEAPDDPASDVEDDDHPDPQPQADTVHPERSRGQEHERGMVSGLGSLRRLR